MNIISTILDHTTKILGYTNDPYEAAIVGAISDAFGYWNL